MSRICEWLEKNGSYDPIARLMELIPEDHRVEAAVLVREISEAVAVLQREACATHSRHREMAEAIRGTPLCCWPECSCERECE